MERGSAYAPRERTPAEESGGDWNALLAQYGQAMMRVGKMEEEVALLQQRLEESQGARGGSEVEALIEEGERELKRREEIIASLRLQVSSLNEELARSQERLKHVTEGGLGHRRHRRHRRPWWMLWRRRH